MKLLGSPRSSHRIMLSRRFRQRRKKKRRVGLRAQGAAKSRFGRLRLVIATARGLEVRGATNRRMDRPLAMLLVGSRITRFTRPAAGNLSTRFKNNQCRSPHSNKLMTSILNSNGKEMDSRPRAVLGHISSKQCEVELPLKGTETPPRILGTECSNSLLRSIHNSLTLVHQLTRSNK